MFFDIIRILKEKKPKYILLENVKGLINHDKGRTFDVIIHKLNELGYTIDFTIINSKETGYPQSRERLYICGIYNFPTEKYNQDSRNKRINNKKKELNLTDFKSFNLFENVEFTSNKFYIEDFLDDNEKEYSYLKRKGLNEWLENKQDIQHPTSNSHKIIKLFDIPKDIFKSRDMNRRVYSTKGISPTISTKADRIHIFTKDKKIREFTITEYFRIQGYDEDFIKNIFKTKNSKTQLYKQVGNSVTPQVISGILKCLLKNE